MFNFSNITKDINNILSKSTVGEYFYIHIPKNIDILGEFEFGLLKNNILNLKTKIKFAVFNHNSCHIRIEDMYKTFDELDNYLALLKITE